MAIAIKVKANSEVEADREPIDALIDRMLAGAKDRIHADVLEAQRLGIIDAQGNLLSNELPDDMRPGAQRDFGG